MQKWLRSSILQIKEIHNLHLTSYLKIGFMPNIILTI